MSFLDFFRTKRLSSVLGRTYKVKVHGVLFELRKVHPLDFINGSKAVQKSFDVYKTAGDLAKTDMLADTQKKTQDHYRDVFLASVVSPKLVRKQEESDQGVWVEGLFSDWELANDLFAAIMKVTYGKKKMKLFSSLKTNLQI